MAPTAMRLPIMRELVSALVLMEKRAIVRLPPALGGPYSTSTSGDAQKAGAEGVASSSSSAAAGTPPKEEPASSTSPSTLQDEEWTEVVHSSGQIYYWNERTGETTQLGQPKPESGGKGGGSGGRGGGAGGAGASAAGGTSSGFDPRAEAPLDDKTGTYAAVGIFVGAFLGWVSQFV